MGSHRKHKDSSSESSDSSDSDSSSYKKSKKKSRKQSRSSSSERETKHKSHKKSRHYSEDSDKESSFRKHKHSEPDDRLSRRNREDRRDHSGKSEYRDREDHHRGDRQEREHRHHDHRSRGYHDRDNKRDFKRENRRRSSSYDHGNAKWGKQDESSSKSEKNQEKQKPNFGLSGKLTEETNTFKGHVIKYSEPPEARKPRRRWRLYPFKGEKALQTLYIHRESAYLIGRERKIVDLPVDHPSCSKQHAALQYRLVPFTRDDGTGGKRVRPYLIDLESANGTFINNKKIEPKKYVELLEKDVIKFGFSSREYVLLHENSKDEAMDDDVKMEELEELPIKEEP